MKAELKHLQAAAGLVYQITSPTPLISWPLLSERAGTSVWVKHENHHPTGSFKIRGAIVYLSKLQQQHPDIRGVVAATRGNFGQSVACAAAHLGMTATIVVPLGNSPDKNAAMRALGAELIESGQDFDEAIEVARQVAGEKSLHLMPAFDLALAEGVASYGLEMFSAQPGLDRVYVPIGLGSGICGVSLARQALGVEAEIIGVVAAAFDAYAQSFLQQKPVSTGPAWSLADGLSVRNPAPGALDIILQHVSRIVVVDDREISRAMQYLFDDTHNIAEGAGAAALAAL
ncbi:MAG: threonine dehydratase, partial [Pseudomonadales bacterium]|nr:threonine dehydratase [Pseudomonadales bacterium]